MKLDIQWCPVSPVFQEEQGGVVQMPDDTEQARGHGPQACPGVPSRPARPEPAGYASPSAPLPSLSSKIARCVCSIRPCPSASAALRPLAPAGRPRGEASVPPLRCPAPYIPAAAARRSSLTAPRMLRAAAPPQALLLSALLCRLAAAGE